MSQMGLIRIPPPYGRHHRASLGNVTLGQVSVGRLHDQLMATASQLKADFEQQTSCEQKTKGSVEIQLWNAEFVSVAATNHVSRLVEVVADGQEHCSHQPRVELSGGRIGGQSKLSSLHDVTQRQAGVVHKMYGTCLFCAFVTRNTLQSYRYSAVGRQVKNRRGIDYSYSAKG